MATDDSTDEPENEVDVTTGDSDESTRRELRDDERTWGILVHASGFVGLLIPLGNVIVPLLIWLIKRDESEFVDANGRNAVNFQISWSIYLFVSVLLIFVLIGFLLAPLIALGWLILVIVASVSASNEEVYEYPLTIDFIS